MGEYNSGRCCLCCHDFYHAFESLCIDFFSLFRSLRSRSTAMKHVAPCAVGAAAGMSTAEVIRRLCREVGHEEGAAPIVKKLKKEQWLHSMDDLWSVPRERLETFGLPLRLVEAIAGSRPAASAVYSGEGCTLRQVRAYLNYSVLPTAARWFDMPGGIKSLQDDAERRRNPDLWATRKLQRAYRRRRSARRRREEGRRLEAAMKAELEEDEYECKARLRSPAEAAALRDARARERLARLARQWRQRRKAEAAAEAQAAGEAEAPATTSTRRKSRSYEEAERIAALNTSGLGSAVSAATSRRCRGRLKDCEVTKLMKLFAKQIGRDWELVEPHAHQLVTFNWLESAEDLQLIEHRHWVAWNMPEVLAVMIRDEVFLNQRPGLTSCLCAMMTGSVSCCFLGDMVGAGCDLFAGFVDLRWEQEQNARREEAKAALADE
eukprot:TRINITY_DN1643_c0_g4_i1.p1 TRINITY_DN1643_c0_g4~~TRINITY_DN1643_c0_g4_i1.p1  ORF type:complete len:465 (+),score=99.07 TRINITY_DN1643_c0_g4_i1:93-1397(+)